MLCFSSAHPHPILQCLEPSREAAEPSLLPPSTNFTKCSHWSSAPTCGEGQVHTEEKHVVLVSNATAVGPHIVGGKLGQCHHKHAPLWEVCESHAATIAVVSVVVAGHDGEADPPRGSHAAPVLPLVPVD